MGSTVIEAGNVDTTGVPPSVLGQAVGMGFKLVGFEVHVGIKDDKLFFQTFLIGADKVVFAEMELESVVIEVVLRLAATVTAVADVTSLVLVAAMCVELVVAIEALSAKATLGMALEAGLILGARVVVAVLFVFAQLGGSEELVLVGKDFFVAGAKVAVLSVGERRQGGGVGEMRGTRVGRWEQE